MKNFLYLLPFVFLAACSSSPEKSSSASQDDYSGKVEVDSVTPSSGKVSSSEAAAARESSKAAHASALAEAVKAGSDEGIYHASTSMLMQNPNDVKALNALGLYHYRKGRPLAARLLFSKALSQQPNSSDLYNNIGLTYLLTKEEPEAIRSFRKAIELNPADVSAATNLGSIYMEHRDFNKAYTVLSLNPGHNHDLKFLNDFAIASAWKGKTEQAESLYREALNIAPNNRELLFNYAIFQIDMQSKFKEGLETLDQLRLIGLAESMKNTTKELENRAKAGLK